MTDETADLAAEWDLPEEVVAEATERARSEDRPVLDVLVEEGHVPRDALADSATRVASVDAEAPTEVVTPAGGGPAATPDLPDRLGSIRVEDLLGRGGMGAAYRGHDEALDRPVVVKVLASHLAESETFRKRFLREARAAARLDHPNIVTIHAVDEVDGLAYMVLQLVPGESLDRRLRREGPLEVDEALDLVEQAARGVAAAHDRGIVHRDLKPANLMVTPEDQVKVLDFGLARTEDAAPLSQTGEVLGTIAYMPPEQAEGTDVDERADVYSLGATLYALLAGEPPFEGPPTAVLKQLLLDPPRPLSDARPDAPGPVVALVERALAKDPADRHPSVEAFAEEVRAMRAGEGATADPAGSAPAGTSTAGPGRAWLLAPLGLLLFVPAMVGIVWMFGTGGPDEPSRPDGPGGATPAGAPAPSAEDGSPPDEATRDGLRARILELDDPEVREAQLTTFLERHPDDAEARAALGDLRLSRVPEGPPATRLEALRDLLEAFPGHEAIGRALDDIRPFRASVQPQAPSPRAGAAGTWDPVREEILLYGGIAGEVRPADLWAWTGSRWVERPRRGRWPREGRIGPGLARDPVNEVVLLFGGEGSMLENDLWAWSGEEWIELDVPHDERPPGRAWFGMAADPGGERIVVFGGIGGAGRLDDTWTWDGDRWREIRSIQGPPALMGPAMAHDPARDRIVLFGGEGENGRVSDETWILEGRRWTRVETDPTPAARFGARLAWDPAARELVLVGGEGADDSFPTDVWAWDGESWNRRSPLETPPGRHQPVLVTDPVRRTLLLFGGSGPDGHLGDTWLYGRSPDGR